MNMQQFIRSTIDDIGVHMYVHILHYIFLISSPADIINLYPLFNILRLRLFRLTFDYF